MAGLLGCLRQCDLDGAAALQCVQSCIYQFTRCDADDFGGARGVGGGGAGETAWLPAYVSIGLAVALTPATGLFAGLTIGLLSLDNVSLRILEHAGEPKEREYARKIIPVRKQGNMLLCTLLLGNTIINSAISILLADLTTGTIGLVVSTFLIVVFGEIIPQSICTRHGLYVGAHSIWIVKIFMALLSPVVWPTSVLLDWVLGRDIGTVYSREELKRLIDIHASDPDAQRESGLTHADQRLIIGALDYKNNRVRDVMTALEQCFMLDRSLRLTFQTMLAIYKSGFTRIPVFEGERQNIVAVLYAKDLILVDPDDAIEIGTVLSFRGRNVAHISQEAPLDEVMRVFLTANTHLLVAHAPVGPGAPVEAGRVTGLITMEDVMETLIQQEIVDETDVWEDVNAGVRRRGGQRADVANLLAMFEHKLSHLQELSPAEMQAVFAFLQLNVEEFQPLAPYEVPLKGLISHAEVLELELGSDGGEGSAGGEGSPGGPWHGSEPPATLASRVSKGAAAAAAAEAAGGRQQQVVLYERGVESDAFTLILQGRVQIRTGAEDFELEVGPWSGLGHRALSHPGFVPDFDAVGVAPLRALRIRRPAYLAALEATSLQPVAARQRPRGLPPGAVSLEIEGPEGSGPQPPPRGASPPVSLTPPLGSAQGSAWGEAGDFDAAAYLQRKSQLPLDHRIRSSTGAAAAAAAAAEEAEAEAPEDRPLLGGRR